jgi:hypothetical protein
MPVPRCFVWTKFGTEAGQSISDILRRKEQERISNGGVFYWGIGNAVGRSISELLRQSDEPEVLFSPIKSDPKTVDVAPESVVAWTVAAGLDGEPYRLPMWSLITSRFSSRRLHHYALVCGSASSLVETDSSGCGTTEWVSTSELSNLLTRRPLGSSQVTAVVHRRLETTQISNTKYPIRFRARLVPPYFIRLSEPRAIVANVAYSWPNMLMKTA